MYKLNISYNQLRWSYGSWWVIWPDTLGLNHIWYEVYSKSTLNVHVVHCQKPHPCPDAEQALTSSSIDVVSCQYKSVLFLCIMSTAWSTNMFSTCYSPMTKEYNWQIINMSVMPFCHWQAACTYQVCAPSSWLCLNEHRISAATKCIYILASQHLNNAYMLSWLCNLLHTSDWTR